MATLEQALGSAGPGRSIVLDGNTFTVRKINQGQKAEFCRAFCDRIEAVEQEAADKARRQAREKRKHAAELQLVLESAATTHEAFQDARNRRDELLADADAREQEAIGMMRAFRADVAKGKYEWGEPDVGEFLNTNAGGMLITLILLRGDDKKLTLDDVERFYSAGGMQQARELHRMVQWALGFIPADEGDEKNVLPTPELKAAS